MTHGPSDTVLLVCGCPDVAESMLEKLYAAGIGVVGPASTARLALTLAAQTQPTMAMIASPPTGERDAMALGAALMETWGLRTWVLESVTPDSGDRTWSARPSAIARLRNALREEVAAA